MSTGKKKRVMVFMLAPPIPAVAGGDIYAINAILPFCTDIDFYLFCYVSGDDDVQKIERNRERYTKVFRSIHTEMRPLMPYQLTKTRRVLSVLNRTVRGLPFVDASYFSWSAVRAARRLVRQYCIDALEINSAHLAFFAKYVQCPAILVGHNIESDLFPFWVRAELTGWRRVLVEWVARRSRYAAREVEVNNAYKFAAMTFISRRDMARVRADVPKYHVPLFFSKQPVPYGSKPSGCFNVLWMGGFGWYPNAEGVAWFLREVFPLLQERLVGTNICFHFCGKMPPSDLVAHADGRHVYVHGFVDDIDTMLATAHLLMVPLLSGGGIRVKIIEAMSAGVPVLSTRKGCEGIDVHDDREIIVRDTPAEFADGIVSASEDPQRMRRLSGAALQFITENYSQTRSLDAKRRAYVHVGVLS